MGSGSLRLSLGPPVVVPPGEPPPGGWRAGEGERGRGAAIPDATAPGPGGGRLRTMPPLEEVPPGAQGALVRRSDGSGGGAAGALSVGQREVVRGIAAAAARSLRGPATINFASKANRKQNDAARRRLVQLATEAVHQTNPFRPAPAAAVRAALAAAAAAERDRITKSEKSSADARSSDLDSALVFARAGRREPGKVGHPHYLPAAAVFRHAALGAVETALLRHDFAAIAHLAAPLLQTEPPVSFGDGSGICPPFPGVAPFLGRPGLGSGFAPGGGGHAEVVGWEASNGCPCGVGLPLSYAS